MGRGAHKCHLQLINTMCSNCTGPAQDWAHHQSAMDQGGAHPRVKPLQTEIPNVGRWGGAATISSWDSEIHVTQMPWAKLCSSQNKTKWMWEKAHWRGSGEGWQVWKRQESVGVRVPRIIHHKHAWHCQRMNSRKVIKEKIQIKKYMACMWVFTAAFYRTQPIENAQMPLDK